MINKNLKETDEYCSEVFSGPIQLCGSMWRDRFTQIKVFPQLYDGERKDQDGLI